MQTQAREPKRRRQWSSSRAPLPPIVQHSMTSHPSMCPPWSATVPDPLTKDFQDFQAQQAQQGFWPLLCDQTGYEPTSEGSMPSSPEEYHYQVSSADTAHYQSKDYFGLEPVSTPPNFSAFGDTASEPTQLSVDMSGAGANKGFRRREQNRAS